MIWLQRDPLGQLAGPDEYAYVMGEPRDAYDPMGLLPVYEPETNPDGTIIERPGKKDGKPGVHIYYYPEEFTWWGPDGPGYYPTPDPPRKVFVPDSTRDLDMMDDTGRTATQRRQMRDLDAAASAGYVAVDNGYKATIFLVSLAIPGPDDILIAVAAKYGAKEIRLVAGQIRGIKDDGSEIVLDAADDALVRTTPAFRKEQAAQKAAEDAKNASKGGQSPTKGSGCSNTGTAPTVTPKSRSFKDRLKDYEQNPDRWKLESIHAEPGRSRKSTGGTSEQLIYRNTETGETLVRHRVRDKEGKVRDDHFRPEYKPRMDEVDP